MITLNNFRFICWLLMDSWNVIENFIFFFFFGLFSTLSKCLHIAYIARILSVRTDRSTFRCHSFYMEHASLTQNILLDIVLESTQLCLSSVCSGFLLFKCEWMQLINNQNIGFSLFRMKLVDSIESHLSVLSRKWSIF